MVSFDWLQEEEASNDIQAVSATSSDDDSSSDHVVAFEHLLKRSLDLMNNKPNPNTEEEFMEEFVKSYPYCSRMVLGYHDTLSLNWLIDIFDRSMNGVLAYEKIEENIDKVLYLLAYLQQLRRTNGPHLILTPKLMMDHWIDKINRIVPELNTVKYHDLKEADLKEADLKEASLSHLHICIASFEDAAKDVAKEFKLSKIKWQCTIVDHIHLVTKEKSVLSKMLMMIESRSSMVITRRLPKLDGDLSELPIFLNLWLPKLFIINRKYEFGPAQKPVIIEMMNAIYSSFPSQYPKSELPIIKEAILRVGMSEVQMQYYRAFIESTNMWVGYILTGSGFCSKKEEKELLKLAINLCECCCHPYMVQPIRGPPHKNKKHLIDNSGKMKLFVEILKTFQDQPKKLVVFSQFYNQLTIIQHYFETHQNYGFQCLRLDEESSWEKEKNVLESFKKPNIGSVLLLPSRTGGRRLNLTCADRLIYFDPDWDPKSEAMRLDQIRGDGQKPEVYLYRLCAKTTIEAKIIERSYKVRSAQEQMYMEEQNDDCRPWFLDASINVTDLLQAIRYNARTLVREMKINIECGVMKEYAKKESRETKVFVDSVVSQPNRIWMSDLLGFVLEDRKANKDYEKDTQVAWWEAKRLQRARRKSEK